MAEQAQQDAVETVDQINNVTFDAGSGLAQAGAQSLPEQTPAPVGAGAAAGTLGLLNGLNGVGIGAAKIANGEVFDGSLKAGQGVANTVGGGAQIAQSLQEGFINSQKAANLTTGVTAAERASSLAGTVGKFAGVAAGGFDVVSGIRKLVNGKAFEGGTDLTKGVLGIGSALATGALAATAGGAAAGIGVGTTALGAGESISKQQGYFGKDARGNNLSSLDDAVIHRDRTNARTQHGLENLSVGGYRLNGTARNIAGHIAGGVVGTGKYLGNTAYSLGRRGLEKLGVAF